MGVVVDANAEGALAVKLLQGGEAFR